MYGISRSIFGNQLGFTPKELCSVSWGIFMQCHMHIHFKPSIFGYPHDYGNLHIQSLFNDGKFLQSEHKSLQSHNLALGLRLGFWSRRSSRDFGSPCYRGGHVPPLKSWNLLDASVRRIVTCPPPSSGCTPATKCRPRDVLYKNGSLALFLPRKNLLYRIAISKSLNSLKFGRPPRRILRTPKLPQVTPDELSRQLRWRCKTNRNCSLGPPCPTPQLWTPWWISHLLLRWAPWGPWFPWIWKAQGPARHRNEHGSLGAGKERCDQDLASQKSVYKIAA